MKAVCFATGVVILLAGCASSAPSTAWGKPGVSRLDYGTDLMVCTARASSSDAGNGYRSAGGVQGSNGVPVQDRGNNVPPRTSTSPTAPANPGSTAPMPSGGPYSGTASADYAQRAATQQRAQEMMIKRARAETYRSCLVERGYSEFKLSEEERAKLATFKPESNEYQAYLYSLGTSAHPAK